MDTPFDPRPALRAQLQQRIQKAQRKIDRKIAPRFACLQYEYELAQRLLAKTTEEEAREDWEIEASVLHDIAGMVEFDLEQEREQIAKYEAMIAEIDADLTAIEQAQ